MEKYSSSITSLNSPHVYAIGIYYCFIHIFVYYTVDNQNLANEALKTLKVSKKSQTILITGGTGSGKTETSKHIIDFLSKSNIREIFSASPILEAFGNAKTRGNINSSRFCKQIQVIQAFDAQNILSVI